MPTTFAIRPITPVKRLDGYTFKSFPLAAAADFEQGTPVLLTDGEFDETGVNPALIAGFALASTADYAWKTDTFETVVPSVPVAVANQEFRGSFVGVWNPAFIGRDFGITENAGGIWTVDAAKDGANQRVVIVGVDDEVDAADIDVPVRFIVLEANRQVIS